MQKSERQGAQAAFAGIVAPFLYGSSYNKPIILKITP